MKTKTIKRAISLFLSSVILATMLILPIFAESEENTWLANGDFSSDVNGWNITDSSSKLESVEKQNGQLATGKAAKFTNGGSLSWMYQAVKLQKGNYVWEFTADIYSANFMVGVFKNEIKAENLITGTVQAHATGNDWSAMDLRAANGDYNKGFGGEGHNYVRYEFTLAEESTVCFAVRTGAVKDNYLIADNMVLISNNLINGDFETGDLTGYLQPINNTIQVVDKVQNDESFTLDGYAAYLSANTDYLTQTVKLPTGKYTWTFNGKVNTDGGWSLLAGVFTKIGSDKGGYGTGSSIGTAKVLSGVSDTAFKNDDTATNGYYLAGNAGQYNIDFEFTFELTAETVIYLSMRTGSGDKAYIDNMKLEKFKELDTNNYDFNDGTIDESFVISSENQTDGNRKITVVDSADNAHGKVLNLPKNTSGSKAGMARFYKILNGLTPGETYKVSFDLKMVDYTDNKATDWIAITEIYDITKRPLKLQSGKDILTYEGQIGDLSTVPSKFVAYTGDNTNYSFAPNTNGQNAVITWNGGTDWATYTMEFIAENETYFFCLENYRSVTDLYLDNIQFSVSEEPLKTEIDKSIIQNTSVKSLLVIGNSFAGDTIYQFQKVLDSANENILRVGKFGKGAQTAGYFADVINNNTYGCDFSYAEKGYNGNSTITSYTSFSDVKEFTYWDYVLVQAATVDYSPTYRADVVKLVNALVGKGVAKEKIYLYVPWASRQDYLDRNNNIYKTTSTQIDALKKYVGELESDNGLSGCKIMTVYEEIFDFSKIADNIHRGAFGVNDGLHLNDLGQTLLSMTLLRKFTNCKLSEVLSYTNKDFTNKSWTDNDAGIISDYQLNAMLRIAGGEQNVAVEGDTNYDGEFDIRDLVNIKKRTDVKDYVLGADINKDGSVNSVDIASLRKGLLFK